MSNFQTIFTLLIFLFSFHVLGGVGTADQDISDDDPEDQLVLNVCDQNIGLHVTFKVFHCESIGPHNVDDFAPVKFHSAILNLSNGTLVIPTNETGFVLGQVFEPSQCL